jgi:hypothetical protein
MRIVQSPYQARIVPQSAGAPNLWRCVIEQEDSREVVVLHETARKEDARCMALLELARLEPTGLAMVSRERVAALPHNPAWSSFHP